MLQIAEYLALWQIQPGNVQANRHRKTLWTKLETNTKDINRTNSEMAQLTQDREAKTEANTTVCDKTDAAVWTVSEWERHCQFSI